MEREQPKMMWIKWWVDRWLGDEAVSACSLAAQGLWMRLLCYAAKSREYGVLKAGHQVWGLPEIAKTSGISEAHAAELVEELISKGAASRRAVDHAIYNRRMVREEKERRQGAVRVARHRGQGEGSREQGPEVSGGAGEDVTLGNGGAEGGNGLEKQGDGDGAGKCNGQRKEERGNKDRVVVGISSPAARLSAPAPAFAPLTPAPVRPARAAGEEMGKARQGPALENARDGFGEATATATATPTAKATARADEAARVEDFSETGAGDRGTVAAVVECDYVEGFERRFAALTGALPGRDGKRRALYLDRCRQFGQAVVLDALERWVRQRGGRAKFRGRPDLAALDFLQANGECEAILEMILCENAAVAARQADPSCPQCDGTGHVVRGAGRERRATACACVR